MKRIISSIHNPACQGEGTPPSFRGTSPRRGLLQHFALLSAMVLVSILLLVASRAGAEPLELGLDLSPTFLQDKNYEAFSSDRLSSLRLGADLRFEVGDVDGFAFLPMVGYRYASDSGTMRSMVKNDLTLHDVLVGLRVRKGLQSWLAVFAEVSGGMLYADLDSRIQSQSDYRVTGDMGTRDRYQDHQFTWSACGLAGLEFTLSKKWLESRNVDSFNFGGEIGAGYIRRGDIGFRPGLEGGDENSLHAAEEPSWGDVNLSGWLIQIGLEFRFF